MNLILDETAVTLSGTNAADFTVTDQPDSPVAPGNSTTFTVVFDPSESGTRSAVINIASTNLDESPFTFAVQGDSNYLLYMPFAGN